MRMYVCMYVCMHVYIHPSANPGHVRKLPVTCSQAVVFAGCSTGYKLQLAGHDFQILNLSVCPLTHLSTYLPTYLYSYQMCVNIHKVEFPSIKMFKI